jgi:thioredoxin-like negative regulator of GroEL
MTTLLVVLATCLFAWCAVLVLVRRVVRSARRVGARLSDRARSSVLAHGTGPAAEAARLRRDMDRAVAGARRALTAAASVGAPTGDARSLLARLELAARSVDGELRVLEAHPDSARVGPAMAGLRERAALVRSAAAELVDGLLDAAGYDAGDLTLLHTACVIEAEALRTSVRARSRL